MHRLFSPPLFSQETAGNWYKGDLHAHSAYSDVDSSAAEVIAHTEFRGLDCFYKFGYGLSAQSLSFTFTDLPDKFLFY
jgi:hypothetical protein